MLTVIAPFLNEINFVKAWAENVSKYADQVVVMDTGSRDGSYELLSSYGFDMLSVLNEDVVEPYRWNESHIRNILLRHSLGDWIVPQDMDELMCDSFIEFAKNPPTRKLFVRFPIYTFQYSLKVRKLRRWNWERVKYGETLWNIRLFQNLSSIKYVGGNHCYLTYRDLPKGFHRFWMKSVDIPVFHYHTMFPPKKNDNTTAYYEDNEVMKSYLRNHPPEVKYMNFNE